MQIPTRLLLGLLTALSLVMVFATPLHADQATDAQLAQALFDEARVLMDQKRFAEACPKLAESQRLDPGGGTLLNLAVCHAGEGKIATALVEYHEALAAATRDGRKDREQIARSSIASLERDVPRLTIIVPRPTPGMEVRLDATIVPPAAFGVGTTVDPGTHVVTATYPGQAPVTAYVEIAIGERKSFEVPPANASGHAPASYGGPQPVMVVRPRRANPWFWGAFGLLMGGAVVSGVTGVLAISKNSTASDGCIEERAWCKDQASRDALSEARTMAWISTGALIGAGIGAILMLALPSKVDVTESGSAAKLQLTPRGLVF